MGGVWGGWCGGVSRGGLGVGLGGMAPQENLGFRSSDLRLTLMQSER